MMIVKTLMLEDLKIFGRFIDLEQGDNIESSPRLLLSDRYLKDQLTTVHAKSYVE